MEPVTAVTKTKAGLLTAVVFGTAVLSAVMHHLARGYLEVEAWAGAALRDVRLEALAAVGLEPVTADKTVDELIEMAAVKWNVKPALVHAVADVESGKSPAAYSVKGAIGVLQVMPGNAKRCGLPHPGRLWDEAANVDCGTRILAEEPGRFGGDVVKAFTVYNCGRPECGPGREYAAKVLARAGGRLL